MLAPADANTDSRVRGTWTVAPEQEALPLRERDGVWGGSGRVWDEEPWGRDTAVEGG